MPELYLSVISGKTVNLVLSHVATQSLGVYLL